MLTLKRFGVTTLLLVSLAMPATAAAQGQDLRNPDRQFPSAPPQTQDLRNPDRQFPSAPPQAQDLRNADRRAPANIEAAPVEAPPVTTIQVPGDGFDWGDAGIGAVGGIAVLALLAGLTTVVTHRRHRPRVTA